MKSFFFAVLVTLPAFAADPFAQADKAQAKGEAVKPIIVRQNPVTGEEVVLGAGLVDEKDLRTIIESKEDDTNRADLVAKVTKLVDNDKNEIPGFKKLKASELPEKAWRWRYYGGYYGGYRGFYGGGYYGAGFGGGYYGGCGGCGCGGCSYYVYQPPVIVQPVVIPQPVCGCYNGCYSGCYNQSYYYSPVAQWGYGGLNYTVGW